jgi:CubicO group peptidase (beta-lactamase class C family)
MEEPMSSNDTSNWEALCEFAEAAREKHNVPGVVLGILDKGVVKAAGFGMTNRDHPLEVTDETLFQIGSITKTFTGTLVMRLVEEGEIDLDATVRTYLPDFKVADEEASKSATIQHLLTHTSGWFGDFFFDTGLGKESLVNYTAAMADLEQLAPIGRVWSYNNAGFSLLGRVIEEVAGTSYQEALAEKVLLPLGLENTFFDPGDLITYRFAVGHIQGEVARPWPLPRSAYPAGGITCSIHDLLTYAQFHLGDGRTIEGEQLLKKETLLEMQTPQATVWDKEQWGLSWAVNDTYETRLVSHGGGTNGQVSQLILVPEKNFAIAVFTNADEGGKVTLEVTRQVLKDYVGVEITDPEPMEVDEEILAQYVGSYTRPFMDIHLGLLGGRLVAQVIYKMGFPDKDAPPPPAPQPFTVGLYEEDRLIALDGPNKSGKADIIRLADGSIGWLRFGRIHKKQE